MELESINKRQQKRLPARPLGPSGIRMTPPYRILDISGSGCLLESRKALGRVASTVPLELPVPARTESPVVRAKIVWERMDRDRGGEFCFRYGLSFWEMDGASCRALNLYLDYLKRNHHVNRLDEAWRSAQTQKAGWSPPVLCEEPDGAGLPDLG